MRPVAAWVAWAWTASVTARMPSTPAVVFAVNSIEPTCWSRMAARSASSRRSLTSPIMNSCPTRCASDSEAEDVGGAIGTGSGEWRRRSRSVAWSGRRSEPTWPWRTPTGSGSPTGRHAARSSARGSCRCTRARRLVDDSADAAAEERGADRDGRERPQRREARERAMHRAHRAVRGRITPPPV